MAGDKANGKDGAAATTTNEEVDFKDISIEEALKILECTDKGLTAAEVTARLEQYGPNKLPESTVNPILRFLGYMWNPLSWAMEVAAIISIALLDFADFAVITALLLCNALISYREEANADKAIKALTSALAPKAKALRDGKVEQIDAVGLVPGDVIVCRIGDIVPADIKLLGDPNDTSSPLQVDQAALTGESLPVKKFPGHVAFSGSTIKQGEVECLVYATGSNTFFGRAAALISGTHSVANIAKVMTNIGAACLITIGIWVVIELAVQFGKYNHECVGGIGGCPTLTNMLVIVVGGVPIAMPTVLSVTLALGAARLAKEGAIVARMSAVEEMAGMSILCSDKTGTLTLNKLSVDASTVLTLGSNSVDDVLKYSALSAQIDSEEAIDIVLIESYPGKATMWDGLKQSKFVPFNPVDKYTISHVTNSSTGETYRLLKGAPQVVLRMAANKDKDGKAVNDKIVEFANRGFRALGVAKTSAMEGNDSWEMLGLLPLFDPPRHDTKQTIEECLKKGISVKMVTGDQLLIGKEVSRQLGMGTNMFTTDVLLKAKEGIIHLDGVKDVDELVEHADGFAEVFPEHKYAIVEILQNRGHLVGMTGDGVNDAPALKKADVGIAVDGATEAARGAADIVLTEPGLSTIVTAIIGARKIFQRMNTYAKYTVAMTFRICLTFGVLTVVYNWYFPTLLTVLLAVFNDGAMIALSKDRVTPSQLPNSWKLQNIFISGAIYGVYLSLSSWALWYVAAKTAFFRASIRLPDLENRYGVMQTWCINYAARNGIDVNAPSSTLGGGYAKEFGNPGQADPSILVQCVTEQKWMRESMLRTLLYLQVSVSGQALVFVVRTQSWSFKARAAGLTYAAFFIAQVLSTIIAVFGFNGYPEPRQNVRPCEFCRMSGGGRNAFFASNIGPQANTEGVYIDSIMGCLAYAVVAWIWAFIWYIPLDLIKWIIAYILNEDGFRDRMHGRDPAAAVTEAAAEGEKGPNVARVSTGVRPALGRTSVQGAFISSSVGTTGAFGRMSAGPAEAKPKSELHTISGGPATWSNPTGRVSVQFGPGALERASVVNVQRRSTGPSYERTSVTAPAPAADAGGIQDVPKK